MIVTDLDGTLLNSKNSISEKNREAFKKAIARGILPIVATGRIAGEAYFFAEKIGALDYVISGNGGIVEDYKNNGIIHKTEMEDSDIQEFLEMFEQYDETFCQAHTSEGCLCTEKTFPWMENAGWAKAYVREFKDKQIVVDDIQSYISDKKLGVSKFVLSSVNYDLLDELMEKTNAIPGMKALRPMDYCLECIPAQVDKGYGLIKLCEYLGIDLGEVMVIGDSDNDLEMFELHSPIKVAVANAYDCIKELADYIVGSNDEDGVAEAIEKYVFK